MWQRKCRASEQRSVSSCFRYSCLVSFAFFACFCFHVASRIFLTQLDALKVSLAQQAHVEEEERAALQLEQAHAEVEKKECSALCVVYSSLPSPVATVPLPLPLLLSLLSLLPRPLSDQSFLLSLLLFSSSLPAGTAAAAASAISVLRLCSRYFCVHLIIVFHCCVLIGSYCCISLLSVSLTVSVLLFVCNQPASSLSASSASASAGKFDSWGGMQNHGEQVQ